MHKGSDSYVILLSQPPITNRMKLSEPLIRTRITNRLSLGHAMAQGGTPGHIRR